MRSRAEDGHERFLRPNSRLQYAETCGIALLDYQTKKTSLEERLAAVESLQSSSDSFHSIDLGSRTKQRGNGEFERIETETRRRGETHRRGNNGIENLGNHHQWHRKRVGHRWGRSSKIILVSRLEEIKQDIATKLEKTAQLNLDNSETTRELEEMREAHQMMIDSLKLQMNTLDKELQHIRDTR